jgi:hypothetical protein
MDPLTILLAGQSNLVSKPDTETGTSTSTTRLTADGSWEAAPAHNGVGVAFARAMYDLRHRPGHLIPAAVGGTSLAEWHPGGALYRHMMHRVQQAGRAVNIFIWYQGESDALSQEDAIRYAQRLRVFLANVRRDLGPEVVMAGVVIVGHQSKLPYIQSIRKAQYEVFMEFGMVVVDAFPCELGPDLIHITPSAADGLGQNLALAMLSRVP